MGALSSKYNDTPTASRPYDVTRDGFIIAGGGTLVLEELEHAKVRGAKIYAEIVGWCDVRRADMVQPSGEGAERCMEIALRNVTEPVDYINTHGTSTQRATSRNLRRLAGCSASRTVSPTSARPSR